MNISDSIRKSIVIGLVLLIVLGLITAFVKAKKQNEAFQVESLYYNEVVQRVQDGNYADALEVSKSLEASQKSSEPVNYIIAVAAVNAGDIEKGLMHMQRTLDINPHRVEDAFFMLQYAEFLVMGDRKEDATKVLERCALLPTPEEYPQYQERIVELQEQIAIQS
ncbi:hypothetical protein [Sporosarcina sp. FSL K6-2383]|uniref:tetratricopeptide repeat protein n=1 Tax=Sporosarcina sp. FSL K6-2383 TaxID=2921556 RepID=UPI003159F511